MLLRGARVLDETFHFASLDLRIANGKIEALIPPNSAPIGEDVVNLQGKTIFPGLVETHIHGAMGTDAMDGVYQPIAAFLAKHGVTSFLPTTMTTPLPNIQKVLESSSETTGANILGYHLEGPYISERYKGAQTACNIRIPKIGEFDLSKVKIITIAPETEGAIDYIHYASEKTVVSLGHTACTYEQAIAAIDAGATCVTHLYNAMQGFSHRDPGLLGAAADRGIYAQLIADGVHVHPSAIRMAYQLFGAERLVLISDAMRAAGMPDGIYDLGGMTVHVKEGIARIEAGNLAGGTSHLWHCIQVVCEAGIPLEDAVRMASLTPATMIGATQKGVLAVGKDADLFVVDEKNEICATMIGGEFLK